MRETKKMMIMVFGTKVLKVPMTGGTNTLCQIFYLKKNFRNGIYLSVVLSPGDTSDENYGVSQKCFVDGEVIGKGKLASRYYNRFC